MYVLHVCILFLNQDFRAILILRFSDNLHLNDNPKLIKCVFGSERHCVKKNNVAVNLALVNQK